MEALQRWSPCCWHFSLNGWTQCCVHGGGKFNQYINMNYFLSKSETWELSNSWRHQAAPQWIQWCCAPTACLLLFLYIPKITLLYCRVLGVTSRTFLPHWMFRVICCHSKTNRWNVRHPNTNDVTRERILSGHPAASPLLRGHPTAGLSGSPLHITQSPSKRGTLMFMMCVFSDIHKYKKATN